MLTHYVHGTMHTLREDLKVFINSNMDWLDKACSLLLSTRNIKLDQYVNQLVEPNFCFDEVAITIVCKMYDIHALILCKNTYWTTRSHANYANCLVKLAYFGNSVFKELVPEATSKPVFVGTSPEEVIPVIDHQSTALDQLSSDLDVPRNDGDVDAHQTEPASPAVDQRECDAMDQDLEGTGILPDEELHSNNVTPATQLNSVEQENDASSTTASNIGMQNPPASAEEPVSSKDQNGSTSSAKSGGIVDDLHEQANVTDPGGSTELDTMYAGEGEVVLVNGHTKKDILLHEAQVRLDQYHEEFPQFANNKSEQSESESEEQDQSDVEESDGWEPEQQVKKRNKRQKKTVIPTKQGQLTVKTVAFKKRIPRTRKHTCHLCGETFEMQSSFTKHYSEIHPNDPFQCEFVAIQS